MSDRVVSCADHYHSSAHVTVTGRRLLRYAWVSLSPRRRWARLLCVLQRPSWREPVVELCYWSESRRRHCLAPRGPSGGTALVEAVCFPMKSHSLLAVHLKKAPLWIAHWPRRGPHPPPLETPTMVRLGLLMPLSFWVALLLCQWQGQIAPAAPCTKTFSGGPSLGRRSWFYGAYTWRNGLVGPEVNWRWTTLVVLRGVDIFPGKQHQKLRIGSSFSSQENGEYVLK